MNEVINLFAIGALRLQIRCHFPPLLSPQSLNTLFMQRLCRIIPSTSSYRVFRFRDLRASPRVSAEEATSVVRRSAVRNAGRRMDPPDHPAKVDFPSFRKTDTPS